MSSGRPKLERRPPVPSRPPGALRRSGPMRADGSWHAINGSQIQVAATVVLPGLGHAPFCPVLTFDVLDRDRLRAIAPGVGMRWRRH